MAGTFVVYVYSHAFSFIEAWGHLTFCAEHFCHRSDLPLLFQTANLYNFTMTSDELKLSDNLVGYWTNFPKNSNPNIGLPVTDIWPTFQSNGPLSMQFDVTIVRSFQITGRSLVTSGIALDTRYLQVLKGNKSYKQLWKRIIIESTCDALKECKKNIQWQYKSS